MITRLLKTRFARKLVYLLCLLMVLGGQPLMALEQHVRFVPRQDHPEWLQPWLDKDTYVERLDTWWDGAWEASWSALPERMASAPPAMLAATTFAQSDDGKAGDSGSQGLSDDELRELSQTDAVGFGEDFGKDRTQAPPSPPGVKMGESSFRPPKELIQLMAGKADLDRLPLIPGWNLLSIPEEPADADPAVVLAPIAGAYTRAYAYDNCDTVDPWKVYDPNDAAASDLTVLDHTKGFWLEATSAVDLPSDGILPATTTIQICPGWNLIGYPAGQERHVTNALHTIEGKYIRVYGYDATDPDNPWEVYSVGVPEWGNDLSLMYPGRGYWVLATEATMLEIANEGPDPVVEITSPVDLDVVTDFTDVVGTVQSPILESWSLTYQLIGEGAPVEIASGVAPVESGVLGTFDPTLLINGLYELKLEAMDLEGFVVEETIAVSVEGNTKLGVFSLSFLDLALPVSGLSIELVRSYDTRTRQIEGEFGYGWSLDIKQGSYRNNRPPGDGWEIQQGFLPCERIRETKSHQTTIRLSDREIYHFDAVLSSPAPSFGGCFARAAFEFVSGPISGARLEVMGNDEVFWENESDRVFDIDTFAIWEPEGVRLVTRDARIFELHLEDGVTRLEDPNGNELSITSEGIFHSSGKAVAFERDSSHRITRVIDPTGAELQYSYDDSGDLVSVRDRGSRQTHFRYLTNHYLEEIENPDGVRVVRNDYDEDGRLVQVTDGAGNRIALQHDLSSKKEVVTDRLGNTQILEYDARGNVVRDTDRLGNVTLRTFDNQGNLTSETDAVGNAIALDYNTAGEVTSVTDPLGAITKLSYDSRGFLTQIEDPLGQQIQNDYDARGNLIRAIDAAGAETLFSYYGNGNLASTTDAEGHETTFEYDSFGNPTRVISPLGVERNLTYDNRSNVVRETVERTATAGQVETLVWQYEYDEFDRRTRTTRPDGTSIVLEFGLLGNILKVVNELGGQTSYGYDLLGRLTSITDPDGLQTRHEFDAEGRVVSTTDRASRTTRFEYDKEGRLVESMLPDGSLNSHAYDAVGRLVSMVDPRGNTTSYEYDASSRLVKVTDALGGVEQFEYDALGQQISATDPLGNVTRFTYDAEGRVVSTQLPDLTDLLAEYDFNGRRTKTIDSLGNPTAFSYDADGRLMQVEDALGGLTRYEHDETGNRIAQIDAMGRITRFEFDLLGREVARTLPDGAAASTQYDAGGRPVKLNDFMGRTTELSYDSMDRIIHVALPDGTERSLGYTPTGLRSSLVQPSGVSSYFYDERDRLIKSVDPAGREIVHTWDAAGNRTRIAATILGSTYALSYGYDELDQLVRIDDPVDGVFEFLYDTNGRPTSLKYPNGVETVTQYNGRGMPARFETRDAGGAILGAQYYEYDQAGRRIQEENAWGEVRSFEYDSLSRLAREVVRDSGAQVIAERAFTYDSVGNRLSMLEVNSEGVSSTRTYEYDLRDRLQEVSPGGQYTWNVNGELIGLPSGAVLQRDTEGRLHSASFPDGSLVTYDYDVDGDLIQRTSQNGEGDPQSSVYALDKATSLSRVFVELSDTEEGVYVYAGNRIAARVGNDPASSKYFHTDALGSTRLLTDFAGVVSDRYDYSAFGEVEQREGAANNSFLFAGEFRDPALGFYNLRARWMAPGLGIFTSMDPFRGFSTMPTSLHRYSYAGSDPVNRIDPSGLFFSAASMNVAMGIRGIVTGIQIDVGLSILTMPALDPDGDISKTLLIFALAMGGIMLLRSLGSILRAAVQVAGKGARVIRQLFNTFRKWIRGRGALRFPNGIPPAEGARLANELRDALRLEGRNVAVADMNINGQRRLRQAVSGRASPPGTVPTPTERAFTPLRNKGAIPTEFDTEVKILEEIAADFPHGSKGKVTLYTERPPCRSCSNTNPATPGVVQQFEALFPDIELIITFGT